MKKAEEKAKLPREKGGVSSSFNLCLLLRNMHGIWFLSCRYGPKKENLFDFSESDNKKRKKKKKEEKKVSSIWHSESVWFSINTVAKAQKFLRV